MMKPLMYMASGPIATLSCILSQCMKKDNEQVFKILLGEQERAHLILQLARDVICYIHVYHIMSLAGTSLYTI